MESLRDDEWKTAWGQVWRGMEITDFMTFPVIVGNTVPCATLKEFLGSLCEEVVLNLILTRSMFSSLTRYRTASQS